MAETTITEVEDGLKLIPKPEVVRAKIDQLESLLKSLRRLLKVAEDTYLETMKP